jgi:nitrite reductase (NADH) small subunit
MSLKIATVDQIPEGKGISITADGKQIALFNSNGQIYAVGGTCPHLGGPLGEGYLDDNLVTCPWHGWQFDIKSGKCENMPGECIATYPIEIVGNDIFLTS